MKCPECHYDNPEGHKFCGNCAHPLQEEQAPVIDLNRPHSYTPKFLADKILITRIAIEGERKRVTVLFTDLAGFDRSHDPPWKCISVRQVTSAQVKKPQE